MSDVYKAKEDFGTYIKAKVGGHVESIVFKKGDVIPESALPYCPAQRIEKIEKTEKTSEKK